MSFFNPRTEFQKTESYKNFKKKFPGTVMCFVHKPQIKTYYDSLPVILGVRLIGTTLFAVNLKLLPLRFRSKLLEDMQKMKYQDEPRVVINKLMRGKNAKFMAAAFEVYKIKNIKSKIKTLDDGDWEEFILNNYNSLKNIPRNRMFKVVKDKITNIKNPLKYIIEIVKNNIRAKQ